MVVGRLRASKWEVLHCADDFSIFPTAAEKARLERISKSHIDVLPRQLKEEVEAFALAPKPWERIAAHRSAPDVRTLRGSRKNLGLLIGDQGQVSSPGGSTVAPRHIVKKGRSSSFRKRGKAAAPLSVTELLSAPTTPEMPVSPEEAPERYARCMRLLLLASGMKSFDVVVLMLSTDDENLRMNALLNDMRQMLRFVTRSKTEYDGRPQVVIPVFNDQRAKDFEEQAEEKGLPTPLIIPRRAALPGLVCEVLHPNAHWTGSLEREVEATTADDSLSSSLLECAVSPASSTSSLSTKRSNSAAPIRRHTLGSSSPPVRPDVSEQESDAAHSPLMNMFRCATSNKL